MEIVTNYKSKTYFVGAKFYNKKNDKLTIIGKVKNSNPMKYCCILNET